jgi:3-hydroxybutyryl-CoA dehydrogenase
MSRCIAQCAAQAGCKVWLNARRQTSLDRAAELIRASLDTLASEGLVDVAEIPAILDRISYTTVLEEGAREADLVIECVAEDSKMKQQVFVDLDRFCPPHAILASNTTALNVFDFIETGRPDKVAICHWYTPPLSKLSSSSSDANAAS